MAGCDNTTETIAGTPTEPPAPTVVATPPESPSPEPTPDSSPLATPAASTSTPDGESVVAFAPEHGALTTVQVARMLAPSVVHIAARAPTYPEEALSSTGVATGVVLDDQGHILTSNHAVELAQDITVTLIDGRRVPGTIVGTDRRTDLAVVRIEAEDLIPAMLGNTSSVQVGEEVIAIGHALGLDGAPTVTKGVVSALSRSLDVTANITIVDMIQTDASINLGNSGGPLVNARGEVIGINTAIVQAGAGIGFAINVDDAKFVLKQLISNGVVRRGFLGVTPINLTPVNTSTAGQDSPIDRGVVVARLVEGGPAAMAGMQEFDVIATIGGVEVNNTGELARFLRTHLPNETTTVVFYRDNVRMQAEVTLGERP